MNQQKFIWSDILSFILLLTWKSEDTNFSNTYKNSRPKRDKSLLFIAKKQKTIYYQNNSIIMMIFAMNVIDYCAS